MSLKFWLVGGAFALVACKSEPPKTQPDAAAVIEEVAAPTPDTAAATPDAPDAAAATPDTAAATPDAVAPKAEATVRLIEAGADPKVAMRYSAAVGAEQTANLGMTTELELGANGQKMPTALPKTKMTITAKVNAADPAADTTVGLVISEADIAEGQAAGGSRAAEKLAEVIRGMKGLKGDKVLSARGVSQRFTLAAPEGDSGIMGTAALKPVVQGFERAIDQMTVPFPDEAIGVGAKWEVTQQVLEAGMTLDQTIAFEVTAIKDNVVSLRFTVTLKAPPGKLESTFAGGMKALVTSLEGGGEGTIEVDRSKVLPIAMSAKNKIVMALELDEQDTKRKLEVEMRVALEVTP